MKRALPIFMLLLLPLLQCCDRTSREEPTRAPAQTTSEEVTATGKELLDSLSTSAAELANMLDRKQKDLRGTANEEVEKLFTVQYRVVEVSRQPKKDGQIDSDEEALRLEEMLRDLGKERWACFHVEETALSIRLYCRRPSPSYLRLLLQGVPKVF